MAKQVIAVPFAGGLDTMMDPKQVAMGKLLQAQNIVFKQTGAVSRRWGYSALGTGIIGGGSVANGNALVAFNNELLLFDGVKAQSYIPAESSWSPRGYHISLNQSNKSIHRTNGQQEQFVIEGHEGVSIRHG